jgi:hypothetical protein
VARCTCHRPSHISEPLTDPFTAESESNTKNNTNPENDRLLICVLVCRLILTYQIQTKPLKALVFQMQCCIVCICPSSIIPAAHLKFSCDIVTGVLYLSLLLNDIVCSLHVVIKYSQMHNGKCVSVRRLIGCVTTDFQ